MLILVLWTRYLLPCIQESKPAFAEGNLSQMIHRILKLAGPTLTSWLVMGYKLFHVWLNVVAEALSFGDRQFYKVCPTAGMHVKHQVSPHSQFCWCSRTGLSGRVGFMQEWWTSRTIGTCRAPPLPRACSGH